MMDKKGNGFRAPLVVYDEFSIPQYDPFIQGHRLFFVKSPQFMTNLIPDRMKKIHEEFMKDIKDPSYSLNSIFRRRFK